MTRPSVSIAILPFDDFSPDEAGGALARGFVDDLIVCLSAFRALRVIAAESSARLPALDRPLESVAAEWGLDHVLEGSVRRAGDRLRVTVRLRAIEGQETVWAERFDAAAGDVFAVQDEIASAVAGRLAVELEDARLARARRGPAPAAYDLWLQGMDCLKRASLEGDAESRPLFRRALELDPGFARAHVGLSLSHFNEWSCQAWHLWDESGEGARAHAEKAVELDASDAIAHAVLARIYRHLRMHERADAHVDRALRLNPNDAAVLVQAAIATLFAGRAAEARALAERAIRSNPLHADWVAGVVGWCLFLEEEYAAAVEWLTRGGDEIVDFAAYRAACHAILGDAEAARDAYRTFERQYREKVAFGRAPEPGEALTWAIRVEPFRAASDGGRMPEALRDAGLVDVDVDEARRTFDEVEVRPAGIVTPHGSRFVRDGRVWTVDYEGAGARLVELKGFHDLARLLAEPEQSVHCLELVGAPPSPDEPAVLDDVARRAYRARIEDLQEELRRAEEDADDARVAPARRELDEVVEELARAVGLGGRDRRLGSRVERARSAVTWRVRSAIRKIRAAHPALGAHLERAVRTGAFCRYSPERPTEWHV